MMNSLRRRKHRQVDEAPSFRVGLVREVDPSAAKVRVVFPDYDGVTSYWLAIVFAKTQNDQEYWIPDIGEQVVCLMDSRDEAGCVLGAIYSTADATPVQDADKWYLRFKDGTAFQYDRALHILDLKFQDSSEYKYDGGQHLLDLKFSDSSEFKYDAAQHVLDLRFQDATDIKYDSGGHVLDVAFNDGARIDYDALQHRLSLDFSDSSVLKYDASAHLFDFNFLDGADISYNAGLHSLAISLPAGATLSIAANGALVSIDARGDVQIASPGQIRLGSGALKGVARLGDQVQCPAGTGTITSASLIVEAE